MSIAVGTKGIQRIKVTPDKTAKAMGSGGLEVFATPAMVALMEKTASESVLPQLDEGSGTVGVSLEIKHTAATPLGMEVVCESELVEADGRRLVFEVTARDDGGEIGSGRHERFVIDNVRFMEKVNKKGQGTK